MGEVISGSTSPAGRAHFIAVSVNNIAIPGQPSHLLKLSAPAAPHPSADAPPGDPDKQRPAPGCWCCFPRDSPRRPPEGPARPGAELGWTLRLNVVLPLLSFMQNISEGILVISEANWIKKCRIPKSGLASPLPPGGGACLPRH